MPINFNSYLFSDPVKLDEFDTKNQSGIYMVLYGVTNGKKIAYIGETGNMENRGFPNGHHKLKDMIKQAGSKDNLYLSFHNMPNSKPAGRIKVEKELVETFNPPCNDYLVKK